MIGDTEKLGYTLSVSRAALTGAITAFALYVMSWGVTVLSGGQLPSLFVALFSTAGRPPAYSLLEGAVWSWIAGSAAGTVAALVFNLLGSRRARLKNS